MGTAPSCAAVPASHTAVVSTTANMSQSRSALARLAPPDAIFVGGGFNATLFEVLKTMAPPACRLVVNAVTLETEAVLAALHAAHGGELLRIELAHAAPVGRMRGWVPARPVVQWSVSL